MEQILVRNLPPGTKAALKTRARKHGRSVEAEARDILTSELTAPTASIVDLLWLRDDTEISFEPERLGLTARVPEL